MRVIIILGMILVIVGALGLVYGGISYTSNRDVIDAGPMHIEVDQKKQILESPIASAAVLTLGAVLIYVGRRQRGSLTA